VPSAFGQLIINWSRWDQIFFLCISTEPFSLDSVSGEGILKAGTLLLTNLAVRFCSKVFYGLPAILVATLFAGVCCASAARASTPSAAPDDAKDSSSESATTVAIPGPLRSFLRMAGISQKVSPEEVMPLLARNVFALGYEGRGGRPSEFLVLLIRYVQQARELTALAGPDGVIHSSNCEDAKPLLKVLGYRTRDDCGQRSTFLETADPQRAFLTIDSGFPLPDLEKSLQEGRPFTYTYATSPVPAPPVEVDWSSKKGKKVDTLDMLLGDPDLARFYWALARMDTQTISSLRQLHVLKRMVPQAAVLHFYGSHICIRSGRVIVPGGPAAASAWKELVGASADSPGDFIPKLVAKDSGWLAAYFDDLSSVPPSQQAHFAEPARLRRLYEMFRGKDYSDAGAGVFRSDAGLLLLVTRLRWEPNGEPYVPGNLEVWKKIFRQKADFKVIRDLGRQAPHWDHSSQLLDALFAISRLSTDTGPLQSYLMLSELDARRSPEHRLKPETVGLLASKFADFSDQYLVFSEFPELDDSSITSFLRVATNLNVISKSALRGNALGTFQANLGLWQILARQGEIPRADLNDSWQKVVTPFGKIGSATQLYDAGRSALKDLLLAANGKSGASQDKIINLLAGPSPSTPEAQRVHEQMANRIRTVLDEQRLVSLDTLLALGDGLREKAQGSSGDTLLPLAGELREFEMPQPIFRNSEREQWAAGIYNNRHTELQMRTNLVKIIKSSSSPEQVAEARGQLAPFLRDTLVGLNYAYYEPPGSQILHHNPLFVRSHDFAGDTVVGLERLWQAPQLFGAGSPAGGGAHLVGSLADLPYVLSTAEQDFLAPQNVQALIWRELVPGLLTDAIVPRWWDVSQNELHAVSLYQQFGEELLAASANDEDLRKRVMNILSDRMIPQRSERVEQTLRPGHVAEGLSQLMPADTFYLAAEYQQRFKPSADSFGPACNELVTLSQRYPNEVNWERLSRDFGVPHRVLTQSYARELLNLPPFPVFMGYANRLFAETWDSSNLYWARLADEKGYSPVMLNRLVPELTRRMVEKIFATDFEDWPALLRAARETGEEFREGKIVALATRESSSQP
jgi:hypothetical protein